MVRRMKEHHSFLSLLSNTHPKQRKALLESSTNKQLSVICEIIHNFLQGIIPFDNEEINSITKYRTILRRIGQRDSWKINKSFIVKNCAAIASFLKIVLPKFEE